MIVAGYHVFGTQVHKWKYRRAIDGFDETGVFAFDAMGEYIE